MFVSQASIYSIYQFVQTLDIESFKDGSFLLSVYLIVQLFLHFIGYLIFTMVSKIQSFSTFMCM